MAMQLIVVSGPSGFKEECKLINDLFDHGLEALHLRKPDLDLKAYRAILEEIPADYRNRVALHQFHELAGDYGIVRLHFAERLRKDFRLGAQCGSGAEGSDGQGALPVYCQGSIRSTSVHEARDLSQLQDFDYTFFGPAFNSFSKPGYKGVLDDGIKLASFRKGQDGHENSLKVIALGGIGLNTMDRVQRMGFDGVALLGWIWNEPLKAIDNFKQVKSWIADHM